MKIGIMGFGVTGAAAAAFALDCGDEVFVSEAGRSSPFAEGLKRRSGIRAEFGGHTERLLDVDLIVKSPGISPGEKILLRAARRGIPVVGEIDFVFSRSPRPGTVIAITGTNGKTTVTSLAGAILKKYRADVTVCGNIGLPLSAAASGITPRSTVVMEVSSYQLEDSAAFRPDIAAILNVTPDHLEHHGSWEKYLKAKSRIFANQTPRDYCVFNRDDSACRSLSAAARSRKVFFSARREFAAEGVYYDKGEFVFHIGSRREKTRVKLGIPGAHNTSNALAAFAVARLAGAPVRAIKSAAQRFKGVEHRMETVARRNGVLYINDSKATNVSSTEVALAALDPGIWLILGGRDKGSPYKPLIPSIRAKVKGIFAIGEASLKISRELSPAVAVRQSGDLKTAVAAAARMASPGDTVLLSPACSSYDQFDNFERRGETFKKLVRSMGARL